MAGLKLVTGFCLMTFLQMNDHLTEGCGSSRTPKSGGKKEGTYPDCNFKNGFGGWANQGSLSWRRVNSTRNYDGDVLTGRQGAGDGFAVVRYTRLWFSDYDAELYSHDITGPVCMRFYFYLYGNETGYLKIRTKARYSIYRLTVFTRYGSHGHQWNLAQIYLNFARTSVYQVIISGEIRDSKSTIAIDDISFQNHTCDRLPKASSDFNCTFKTDSCGWRWSGLRSTRFDQGLNQYVFILYQGSLKSPRILERDACFIFEYQLHEHASQRNKDAGIFVFIKDANNSQLLPMWSRRSYYDRGKWHRVRIRLRYQNGFSQVEVRNNLFAGSYMVNFYITPEIDECYDIVDEKTFFVSIKKTSPVQHRISEDGVHCDSYPTSEFIANTIPTKEYPKPMYLFASSRHIILRQTEKGVSDNLIGYFYVSMTRHKDNSAIYYKIQDDKYGLYIDEFRTTALDGNWTGNVMYVKNHQSHKDNGNCAPGYLALGQKDKCFLLMCDDSSNPESRCSEKLATLASLDPVSTRRASEYLKYIKATSIGINQVTVGLSRNDHRWIWRDGRVYNDSEGLLGTGINTKAFLSWKEENKTWVLKSGHPTGVGLHLCEEQGENIAYKSGSNQSSTSLGLSSQFAVDGLLCTHSSTVPPGKSSPGSWWRVELGKAKKIYLVQITWRAESKIGKATFSLERDGTVPNFVKEVTSGEKSVITCGPPLPARFFRIDREKEPIEIYEVDVHATDSALDHIQGVMRSVWENKQGIFTTDHVFTIASSFKAWTERDKFQKLEAYILAPYAGMYNFTFHAHGSVEGNLVISRHKDADDSLMSHSFNKSSGQWYLIMKRSSSIILEACKFYYVKLITSSTSYSKEVFLNIEHKNSSNWMQIETKNLFWVLPGQLEVKLSVDNSTKESVLLTHPVNLTGVYNIKCLGLYCGDCPLAIFIYFSGHIECVITSSRSIAQSDKISLRIVKKWFAFPDSQPIRMGYKTNEDCQSIKMNMRRLDWIQSSGLQEVGKINVKALTVIACDFGQSRLCEVGRKNSAVFINGWSRAEGFDQKGRKVNFLATSKNVTARFFYDGVPYDWIVERTGICMKFKYLTTGDNNTLSVSFKTSSGHLSLLWRLRGNHGDFWKTGGISYMPNESFAFSFEGSVSEPSSTVAIANVLITTEHCKDHSEVFPYFADPDSKCDSSKFLCDNGECIGHSFVCDGDPNCADGSDEKDCQCLVGQFRCLGSGECVEKRFMCNGVANCHDASDEKNCYEGCDSKQFYCPGGICIPWNSTCNGVRDCPDGADEPSICGNTTRTNQTCSLDDLGCLDELRSDEKCAKTEANCDFEEGMTCQWHQVNDGSDDFDWSIGKGETSSKKTGPIADHTTGTKEGSYIYIEASTPRVAGDKATLSAGPFKRNLNFCFTFHYHMFGRHIGRLSVLQSGRNKTKVKTLWTRNISLDIHWKYAALDIKSTEIFYLFIEGVRGDGSQGDIAVDDITMLPENCSLVHDDFSPFCSFETPCSWKQIPPGVWSRMPVNNKNEFMLREHFLKTRSSGKLEIVLSKQKPVMFPCMTFWYKFRYTIGMTFKTMELYDSNMLELSHSLKTANEQWLFAEMPLKGNVVNSKLVIKVMIPSQKNLPYLGIDEINFSMETCLSFVQGGMAWIRKSSMFYNSLTKKNSDGNITAFYDGPNSDSSVTSQSFLEAIAPDHVNYVVQDIRLSDYTNISLESRVLIKERRGFTAVPGIVIAKKTVYDPLWPRFLLTVRFDMNSSDTVVEEQDVHLLPYQLNQHGPMWLTSSQDCESTSFNDSCYFVLQKRNWFDGADDCKSTGGEIARFDSELQEKHARIIFAKFLPFWIGYHGHKYHGKKFVWSDGKEDLYNNLDRRSLDGGLSAGLCVMITANSSLWKRRYCSDVLNVLCRRPDIQETTISKDQEKKTLNCSNLDAVIDILEVKLNPVNTDKLKIYSFWDDTDDEVCKLKPNVSLKVKAMCQFRNWCSLSAKSVLGGNCLKEEDNLTVLYKCVKNSDEMESGNSGARSVFCPDHWKKFRTSCYKAYAEKMTWDMALAYCKRMQGASLVSFNDKKEEEYVRKIMESNRIQMFHAWPRPAPGKDLERIGFMCEYKLGNGSCDFETDWCGWIDYSHDSASPWHRVVEEEQLVTSIFSIFGIPLQYLQPSHDKVDIYLFQGRRAEEMVLNADRPKEITQITLCVWAFISTKNQTRVNLVSFGEKLQLEIYFESENKYRVNFHEWNSLTNAFVSFETWQHLCFSVDTQTMLWKFFEDGVMTDIGTFNLSTLYVTDQSADDNIIMLGDRKSCSTKTPDAFKKSSDAFKKSECLFRGKMTKPNIWSRVLEFHEISVLATGCETTASPDIATEQTEFSFVKRLSFRNGECISGKGTRLTTSKTQNSSLPSRPILISPWMNAPFERVRGVCMYFSYRLLGKDSELVIYIQPSNADPEKIWSVTGPQGNKFWKNGQVSLGLVSEFVVYITATLWSVGSEANIDNIFFMEDYCDPVPSYAQVWHTKERFSGYITSPYYPGLYLNNMRRYWTIEVPKGYHVAIRFRFLDLEFHQQCKRDAVTVYDSRHAKKETHYCGNGLPSEPYVSSGNRLFIVFKTDERDVGTGFILEYTAVPNFFVEDLCLIDRVPECHPTVVCSNIRLNSSKAYVHANDLVKVPEYLPATTTVINFDHNYLIKLGGADFENLTQLEYLSCIDNKIFNVDQKAFQSLTSLQTLRLSENFIKSISVSLFLDLHSLETLDLSKNRINKLEDTSFSSLSYLRTLSLRMNLLTRFGDGVFTGLVNLQYLYLDNNELREFGDSVFDDLTVMKTLILNNNKLEIIKSSWLRNKKYLEILDVGKNKIKEIESGAFRDLRNLVQLDLSGNQLKGIPDDLFENLVSLRHVKVDHFTLCCYAKQNNPSVNCVSNAQDGFSSCDELLKNTVLKYSIWVLGIMAFAGNLIVIVWRSIAKDSNKVNSFLLTNLAVADFLMGIYMLIIAYKDTVWDGVYFKHDFSWRASNLCIFAGVISTVSSEVSVITLTVITIDRLVCIVFPFRFHRWSMKKAASIMCVVWILGLCIALAPLFNNSYFYDFKNNVHFFGRSAVCLPLQLSRERPSGWQYSVSIFLILNGVSFVFILLAYVFMYHTIVKAANAVRSTRMNQDSTLAKRMMFIILTDFFCWFPVIIISILALTGNLYDPSKQVYAWIAVFVLPINSSINPLLYTFSTPYVRKKIPTASRALSRSRRRRRGTPRHYSSDVSVISNLDHLNTIMSPLSTPQSIRNRSIINEGYTPDDNIAESSFTESQSAIEYRIKMVDDVKYLSDNENEVIKSCLAVDFDEEETPCVIHIYKNEDEALWRTTTNTLSWLSLDGGHDNVLQFLWSAKGAKVYVERSDSWTSSKLKIAPDDCLVCYELPSRLTAKKFLQMHHHEITEETVYCILNDLMGAIDYLSSKQIVHNDINPENIILVESSELAVESAILGGLHATKYMASASEEQDLDEVGKRNMEEALEANVKAFGNVIQIFLEVCSSFEKFPQLHDIMESCLSDSKPTTSDLLERLALMDPDYPSSDKVL